MNPHQQESFYGTTKLGEKGQVVIPAEARVAMKLKKGEKMLVFSMGHGMLALAKLENLAKFEQHMSKRLSALRKAVKATK
ncbi:MAG: AbrB/MazE/SpoVT family DNA-binding domain-containing protein [Patescibacteria group bacterium]|jgi:AbrB family looped-hinge helix DNA binding protein